MTSNKCLRPTIGILRAMLVGSVALMLGSCGQKTDGQAEAPKGQVVARVGKQVITIPELDNEFRALGVPQEKRQEPELVRRVVNEMVVRKHLVDKAIAAKLDREPTVHLDILRSRDQVLATASLVRDVNAKVAAISRQDIDKYIAVNPGKFADRRLLSVEQISFPLTANTQAIIQATRDMKSLNEIDQKLTEMGVIHGRSKGSLSSGELPDELSTAIKAKKTDDVFFIRAGQNGVFLSILGEETQPLDGEAAVNAARQLIRNDLTKSEMSLINVSSNLEAKFEGDYVKVMQPDSPAK